MDHMQKTWLWFLTGSPWPINQICSWRLELADNKTQVLSLLMLSLYWRYWKWKYLCLTIQK
jgi:hypothetical protein